ncbi:MAG TPA: bifunctional molybdenum cofactor biosynthesis protein MoaC/MoaB [Candidatus Deferrimicrobium sp.]|nr:bifunctional molybdenum cofactor biosynthesis protein MoaC/MoaB [Candidatus Deferrimicrobium sp.]
MLDISRKIRTLRIAVAEATLGAAPETIKRIEQQAVPKGNPLEVAKVAAVLAAKNTSQLIPYCHPLPIDFVGVEYELGKDRITVTVTVKAIAKTGVEMEALTAACAAALTLYDMLKMFDATMAITGVRLISKKGGKTDFKEAMTRPLRAAVLVMSDSIHAGKKDDLSGRLIVERLTAEGFEVVDYKVIPDEADTIKATLTQYADSMKLDLVVTTGGTGFSSRDTTPEAMASVIEREIPGIPQALRAYGQERTPYSMLSRGKAGIRGCTIIINLPGSKKGVAESLDALFPGLQHAFGMLQGTGSWHREDERAKK